MTPSRLIAFLNSITVGDIDAIRTKLGAARQACIDLDQASLADSLDEADDALARADLVTYRKRVETVVARLGHLR